MELIHIANATFSNRNRNISLENSALKQKTFRIVKEQHDVVKTSRDHSKLSSGRYPEDNLESSHGRAVKRQGWWSQPGSNR